MHDRLSYWLRIDRPNWWSVFYFGVSRWDFSLTKRNHVRQPVHQLTRHLDGPYRRDDRVTDFDSPYQFDEAQNRPVGGDGVLA